MRYLAIIPLLCMLAVACDARSEAVYESARLAAAARVALSPTLDVDATEQPVATPTVQPADATATATATVVATDEADEGRGVVIDGFCPSEFAPVRVKSTRDSAKWGNEWELIGTARKGGIVLEWDEPSVAGVTGYVVTRHSRDSNGEMVQGSVRTFAVDTLTSGRYADVIDIEPRAVYRYRVFPVTADGLGFPTAPLEILSPPAEPPEAPIRATARYWGDRWYVRGYYVFLEPISVMRVLRRDSGEAEWQMIYDDNGSIYPGNTFGVWSDQDFDPSTDYDYAVCLGNAAGISRAVTTEANQQDASQQIETESVQVGPPRDIQATAFPYYLSVYWQPVSDATVTGYAVECQPVSQDHTRNRHLRTYSRARNYVTINLSFPDACRSKFRVRAVTDEGRGPWSEWTEVHSTDAEQPQAEPSKPEIVTLTATHSVVHMVWRTEDPLAGLEVRYLRRRVGAEGDFRAYGCLQWVKLEEFNWEYSCSGSSAGFTDEYDVRPDTEYEYAVQAKREDVISPMSDPVSARTRFNPSTINRRPLPVYDLEGIPTSEGFRLTWELPDDPTLKGILVEPNTVDHDLVRGSEPIVLPPDQTELLVLTRGYDPEPRRYVYDLKTFNDFGTQSVGLQRATASAANFVHCRATTEELMRADVGHHLTIRFRGCEESTTQVIRRELTADGFEVDEINQPCTWRPSEVYNRGGFNHWEGTLKCEYIDATVEPGTWYIYELTQTLADGREFKSHHEIVTRPRDDAP